MPEVVARPFVNYAPNVPGWLRGVDQRLRNLSVWAENVPKFTFADRIKNPVGRVLASIPQQVMNIPSNFAHVAFEDYGEKPTFSSTAKRAAEAAQVGLDIGTLFAGGGAAKAIAQTGMKRAALGQLMKQGAIRGLKQGAGYGSAYGALDAVQNNKPLFQTTAIGGLTGGVFGGAIGGLSPAVGRGFRAIVPERPVVPNMDPVAQKYWDMRNKGLAPTPPVVDNSLLNRKWKSAGDVLQKRGDTILDPITGKIIPKFPEATNTPIANPDSLMAKIKQVFTSGRTEMQRMGKTGKKMADLFDEVKYLETREGAVLQQKLAKFAEMNETSKNRVYSAIVSGTPKAHLRTPQENELYRLVTDIKVNFADFAKKNGLKIVNPQTGKKSPWVGDDPIKYFPVFFSEKQLAAKDFKPRWIQAAIDSGKATNKYEAAQMFKWWNENTLTRKGGKLEYTRMLSPDDYARAGLTPITDPVYVFSKYAQQTARRKAEIPAFGQFGEKLKPMLEKLSNEGYDSGQVQKIYDNLYGSREGNKFIDTALQANLFTKLPLGFFINLTQQQNISTTVGFKAYAQVFKNYLVGSKGYTREQTRKMMNDIAVLSDAYSSSILSSEMDVAHPAKLTDMALWLFRNSEKLNRYVAANAYVNRAKVLVPLLEKNPANKAFIREATKMGLPIAQIIAGKLTPEQFKLALQKVAYKGVINTQFKIDAMEVPLAWRSNIGKLLTQFKSFSFMQTKFIRDEIYKEARKGNLLPLARFMATAPIAYYAANKARGLFTGKKSPEEIYKDRPEKIAGAKRDELIGDITRMTGTLPGDILNNAIYVDKKLQDPYSGALEKGLALGGNFLGPTVSEAANLVTAARQSSEIQLQNMNERPANRIDPYTYPFGKFLAPKIPYFGPGIKNVLFGDYPRKPTQIFKDKLKEAVIAKNKEAIRAILAANGNTINGRAVLADVIREVRMEQMSPEARERYETIKAINKERRYSPIIK